MLEFTWKIFEETGSIDTYLLFKELEKELPKDMMVEDQNKEIVKDANSPVM